MATASMMSNTWKDKDQIVEEDCTLVKTGHTISWQSSRSLTQFQMMDLSGNYYELLEDTGCVLRTCISCYTIQSTTSSSLHCTPKMTSTSLRIQVFRPYFLTNGSVWSQVFFDG